MNTKKRLLFKQMLGKLIAEEQGSNPLDLRVGRAPFTHKDNEVFLITELDEVYNYVRHASEWYVDVYENIWEDKIGRAEYTGSALVSSEFEKEYKKGYKTAQDKFEKRLEELNRLEDWKSQEHEGRMGIFTDDGISIFVNENDECAEYKFPPISHMERSEDFRMRALRDFCNHTDDKFVAELARWVADIRHDCPLYPLDVYFLWDDAEIVEFKDDEEAISLSDYVFAKTTEEYCEYCDENVELSQELKVQKCPKCGKWIVPCSACPLAECCANQCPLERMAEILNKE